MEKIPQYIREQVSRDDLSFQNIQLSPVSIPEYDPKTHYIELTRSPYYHALMILRHYLKMVTDHYFATEVGAIDIDLFMFTPSVSSPMGPGSDSVALPFKFGELDSNLVDSSQFGFEPLLLNKLEKVYCYLPSMRGEDPDKRHLNQFYHCEAEIKGTLEDLMPIIEGYIKVLGEAFLLMPNIIKILSRNNDKTVETLKAIISMSSFPQMTFDEGVALLSPTNESNEFVKFNEFGRDITSKGEMEIARLKSFTTPFWIKYFDRDRVPFYQKPLSSDTNKVVNADLIVPALIDGSFGGETVGCGQRQDNAQEMIDSLTRQNIDMTAYEWYINLRKLPNYSTTSGFGMGVERYISWALCLDNIRDAILYPRIKNVQTYP